MTPRAIYLALTITFTAPALLGAQAVSDSGTFVVRHAQDTVATEQFSRTDTKLDGTLTIRNAKGTSQRWSAVVVPDATLPLIEVTVPYRDLSFALLEQAVRRARATPQATQVAFFNLGGGQTLTARLSPLGTDSLTLDIGSVQYHLRVDPAGRVLGGRIPAQDVVADRR